MRPIVTSCCQLVALANKYGFVIERLQCITNNPHVLQTLEYQIYIMLSVEICLKIKSEALI